MPIKEFNGTPSCRVTKLRTNPLRFHIVMLVGKVCMDKGSPGSVRLYRYLALSMPESDSVIEGIIDSPSNLSTRYM